MRFGLLARAAPAVLGALAAAIWLRRREPEHVAVLPAGPPAPAPPAPEVRPPSSRFVRASQSPAVDIVTVVDDLLGARR